MQILLHKVKGGTALLDSDRIHNVIDEDGEQRITHVKYASIHGNALDNINVKETPAEIATIMGGGKGPTLAEMEPPEAETKQPPEPAPTLSPSKKIAETKKGYRRGGGRGNKG